MHWRHAIIRPTAARCHPMLCSEPAAVSRRDVIRSSLYVAWVCATAVSVGRVADFPPADFRSIVTGVYADALQPCGPGAR
eukprot:3561717-Prymnesium_polylepis.1